MLRKIIIIMGIVLIASLSLMAAELSKEAAGNKAANTADQAFGGEKYDAAAASYLQAISAYQAAEKENAQLDMSEKIANMNENLFKSYYFGKKYSEAIAIKKTGLASQKASDRYKTAKLIAQIYQSNLKNNQLAIDFLTEYAAANPSFKVYKKIGGIYLKQKDLSNALTWYEKAYEVKKDARVIKNIASIYVKLKNNPKAVEAFSNFLKTDPKDTQKRTVYTSMGALYASMDQTTNAIKYLQKALDIKFDKAIATKLVVMHYKRTNYQKVIELSGKILKKYTDNTDALYYRGQAYFNTKNMPAAKADFLKLVTDRNYGKSAKGYLENIENL